MDAQSPANDQPHRECWECGRECKGRFCAAPRKCKQDWNNRRARRGKPALDLLTAWRKERDPKKRGEIMKYIYRLLIEQEEEDMDQRAGRRSTRPLEEVLRERPSLKVTVSQIKIGRPAL